MNAINASDLAFNKRLAKAMEMERTTVNIESTTLPIDIYDSTHLSITTDTNEEPSIAEIEITTPKIETYESTRFSTIVDSENGESTTVVPTEIYEATPLSTILDSENEETTIEESTTIQEESTTIQEESTTESTSQPHKQIPIESGSKIKLEDDVEKEMRQKNNRLHSQYIATLSEDLQRLKSKFDHMKLGNLRN